MGEMSGNERETCQRIDYTETDSPLSRPPALPPSLPSSTHVLLHQEKVLQVGDGLVVGCVGESPASPPSLPPSLPRPSLPPSLPSFTYVLLHQEQVLKVGDGLVGVGEGRPFSEVCEGGREGREGGREFVCE